MHTHPYWWVSCLRQSRGTILRASSANLTPVKRLADNVDFKELKPWRIFVIQFLNMPVSALSFVLSLVRYGPMAYYGCNRLYFMGATHDYFSECYQSEMTERVFQTVDVISVPGPAKFLHFLRLFFLLVSVLHL